VDYAHSHGHEIEGGRDDVKQAFNALDERARAIGKKNNVNEGKLNECLAKQDESVVRASMREGEKLGIEGTPQLFVDGERVAPGAQPTSAVWDTIDRALKADGITPPQRADVAPPKPVSPEKAPGESE
jgi:predicted DsbA family dithiol-disulfide isomerase